MKKREKYYLKRALFGIILVVLLFVLPLFLVVFKSISSHTFIDTLKDKSVWRILLFTLEEATLSAVLSIILSLPFALIFSKYSFPLRRFTLTTCEMCFAFPSVIAVLSFVIFYGNNGLVNTLLKNVFHLSSIKFLYSFPSVIFAHVYLNFPFALSLLTGALEECGDEEEKCSYTLKKGKIITFFRITLPKIIPSILSSFTTIFLLCYSSFLIVLTLGGSVKYYTMEAEIYKRVYGDGNINSASSLALFSFIFTSLILVLFSFIKKKEKNTRNKKILIKAKGKKNLLCILASLLILLFILPPVLSLLYRSFFSKDGGFSLSSWSFLFTREVIESILNSTIIGLLSSLFATFISYSLSLYLKEKRFSLLPTLYSLPLSSGSVTIGLGFLLLSSFLKTTSYLITMTFVVLCHTIILLPFTIKIILPEVKHLNPLLSVSAEVLGKDQKSISRDIYFPSLRSTIRRSLSFSFALSLSEVNATLTLSLGKIVTIPMLIYRLINSYNYSGASVLSIVLLALAYLAFFIGNRRRRYELS